MVPKLVFVIGGPGSGKGTQCTKIAENFGYTHLSVGELLRQEVSNQASKFGHVIQKTMQRGEIVPSEITCRILDEAMQLSAGDRFLIDGFPRNKENIECFDRSLKGKVRVMFALYLDCPEGMSTQRCLERNSSGRLDDTLDVLRKRFKVHWDNSRDVVEYFKKQNTLRVVDASKEEGSVYQDIKAIFDKVQFIDDYFVFSVL